MATYQFTALETDIDGYDAVEETHIETRNRYLTSTEQATAAARHGSLNDVAEEGLNASVFSQHSGAEDDINHSDPEMGRFSSRYASRSTLATDWVPDGAKSKLLGQWIQDSRENLRNIAEPEDHNPSSKIKSVSDTSRVWHGWRQKRRLKTLILAEWFATFILCASFASVLYYFGARTSIGSNGQRTFNALTTGLAFLLGANLTASLKSYAKMMRWRILANKPRPLDQFELILSCDGLRNVAKLMITAQRGSFPRISRTSILCCLWLLLNLALAIIAACIGLTYSLGDPAFFGRMKDGNVSFVDLSALETGIDNADMAAVNGWGLRGLNAEVVQFSGHDQAVPYQVQTFGNGSSSYFLQSFDPKDRNISAKSWRQMKSHAECFRDEAFELINDTDHWGGFEWLDHYDNEYSTTRFNWLNAPGYGGVTVWSRVDSDCGWGCTQVSVFVARSPPEDNTTSRFRPQSYIYSCTNTVPLLWDRRDKRDFKAVGNRQIEDRTARYLAGALGWSDESIPDYFTRQIWKSTKYSNATEISEYILRNAKEPAPSKNEMADFISTFTTKTVAAIDDVNTGLRTFAYDEHGLVPVVSQRLRVDWSLAIGLLATIVIGQFVAMIIVFFCANKVVIKDDSPLAMAKLLFSLIRSRKLADHGCMLKGEDIIATMDNPHVVYGWVDRGRYDDDDDTSSMGHVDIFVRVNEDVYDEGVRRKVHTDFKQGYMYD